MANTFIESDLLVDISQAELDGIAKSLVALGQTSPITTTIAEQYDKIEAYTLRYNVPQGTYFRILRALVLYELYSRLTSIPEKRQKKYDEAMSELKDIRDGKFKDLAIESPSPAGIATGGVSCGYARTLSQGYSV